MTALVWIGFIAFVLVMLAIDLGVLHREARVIRFREAIVWTSLCAVLALAFNVLVYFLYEYKWLGVGETVGSRMGGSEAAMLFFACWLIEQSLSVDNIFVIALVFRSFKVPPLYQHRVLFWGVLGALVMRGVMIGVGTAVIHAIHWSTYVFGAFLIYTAIKLLLKKDDEDVDPQQNILVRLARRAYPVTADYHGQRFFVLEAGRRAMTPLFLVLLVVEGMDVMFAVDSIPAVIAITDDTFLVFTSNVFAILSLRSLFFAVVALLDRFRHIQTSLVFVLAFVGVKMILANHYKIPTPVSLGLIVGFLATGVLASLMRRPGA